MVIQDKAEAAVIWTEGWHLLSLARRNLLLIVFPSTDRVSHHIDDALASNYLCRSRDQAWSCARKNLKMKGRACEIAVAEFVD